MPWFQPPLCSAPSGRLAPTLPAVHSAPWLSSRPGGFHGRPVRLGGRLQIARRAAASRVDATARTSGCHRRPSRPRYPPNPMERTPVSRVPDVHASAPAVQLSLSRVGVTNVEKVIRIGPRGAERIYYAKLECVVDLGPEQRGAHMSRFDEVVNDVIGEVVLGESGFKSEQLAQHVAEKVRERQDALRAEVTIAARYPEHKPAPVSGIATQEIYTLYGSAVASERGTRRLVGVAAQGMTACPCAQQIVAGRSRERLSADGFTDDEIQRIFVAVSVATHN